MNAIDAGDSRHGRRNRLDVDAIGDAFEQDIDRVAKKDRRGSTHKPIATATRVSTHVHPVNQITNAAAMTPIEPSMSLHTSRYAPLTLRLASLPPARSRMLAS